MDRGGPRQCRNQLQAEGAAEWKPLAEVPEFAEALPAAAPPVCPNCGELFEDGQPSAPPSCRGPDPTYNFLADKIGGVPNIRKKDNLYQAAAIGVFLIVGVVVGAFLGEWPQGVLLGGLAGLIAGTLISGAILTVIGLCRRS